MQYIYILQGTQFYYKPGIQRRFIYLAEYTILLQARDTEKINIFSSIYNLLHSGDTK